MEFERKTPESVGIPSALIIEFMDTLEKYKVNIHGFSLSVGHTIVAEGYYKPFTAESQHRMYSIAKSFVSVAIGLLQEEGKVSIEDRIADYFREAIHGELHPFLRTMTIRDMLTMQTAHHSMKSERYAAKDWVESFFNTPPTHHPDAVFNYDTSGSHVLGALVEKLSGMTLLDYLKEKVFDTIGMSEEAKILPDKVGTSQGGAGLVATLSDIRGLARLLMDDGVYEGEALIPAEYIKQATAKQVPTDFMSKFDERHGYGFQIWKTREDGFALYGLGGQLALCVPELDLMLVTIADTQGDSHGTGKIHECYWDIIVDYLKKSKAFTTLHHLEECQDDYRLLEDRLDNLSVYVPVNTEDRIDVFDKGLHQLQTQRNQVEEGMALTVTNTIDSSASITQCSIKRVEDTIELHWDLGEELQSLVFGLNHLEYGVMDLRELGSTLGYYGFGEILENGLTVLHARIYEDLCAELTILLKMHDDEVTIEVNSYGEQTLQAYYGLYNGK